MGPGPDPTLYIQQLDQDHLEHCAPALGRGLEAARQAWQRVHAESQLTRESFFGIGRYVLGFAAGTTVVGAIFVPIYALAIGILLGAAAFTGGVLLLASKFAMWRADRASLPHYHKALRIELDWINRQREALNNEITTDPHNLQLLALQAHFNDVIMRSWEALASMQRAEIGTVPSELTAAFYAERINSFLTPLADRIGVRVPCAPVADLQAEYDLLADELQRGLDRAQAVFAHKNEELQATRIAIAALFIGVGIILVSLILSVPIGMWFMLDPFLTLYWCLGIGAAAGLTGACLGAPHLGRKFASADASAFAAPDFHSVLRMQLAWIKEKRAAVKGQIDDILVQREDPLHVIGMMEPVEQRQRQRLLDYFDEVLKKNKSLLDALGKVPELQENENQAREAERPPPVRQARALDLAGREQYRRRPLRLADLI